jgi:hypothetical protein
MQTEIRARDHLAHGKCIWCLCDTTDGHREHIIPVAVGGFDEFSLPGSVVCKACNNGLAHLDRAVADEYDTSAFLARVPGRDGKLPAIRSRGNLVATIEPTGPAMTFNMERFAVPAHDGTKAGPYRSSSRNINAKLEIDGSVARISFKQEFGSGPKFVRGITKIAFSFLAFLKGPATAHQPKYDAIRQFVRYGIGTRHAMLLGCDDHEYRCGPASLSSSENEEYAVQFRIGHADFLADLSEHESLMPMFKRKMQETYGTSGWTVLPLTPPQ